MILPVSIAFNKNVSPRIFNRSDYSKNDFANRDVFDLRQKSQPSFGAIPYEKAIALVESYAKKVDLINDSRSLSELMNNFTPHLMDELVLESLVSAKKTRFSKIQKFVKDVKNKLSLPTNKTKEELYKEESKNISSLRHELKNEMGLRLNLVTDEYIRDLLPDHHLKHPDIAIVTDDDLYLKFQKNEVNELFKYVKDNLNLWKTLEVWRKNPKMVVPAMDVFEHLATAVSFVRHPEISVEGFEILKDLNVKNPALVRDLYSEAIFNSIKYGDNLPIEIKASKSGISIINVKTKPIANDQIIKIMQGNGDRADATSYIPGTGHGVPVMIEILKKTKHRKAIPALIEMNRSEGVCFNLPFINVTN